jgi:hypothetical protein
MANSPNKFGLAPGKTALSLDLLVSVPTALELLLRAKLLLIHAIVAHRREPVDQKNTAINGSGVGITAYRVWGETAKEIGQVRLDELPVPLPRRHPVLAIPSRDIARDLTHRPAGIDRADRRWQQPADDWPAVANPSRGL